MYCFINIHRYYCTIRHRTIRSPCLRSLCVIDVLLITEACLQWQDMIDYSVCNLSQCNNMYNIIIKQLFYAIIRRCLAVVGCSNLLIINLSYFTIFSFSFLLKSTRRTTGFTMMERRWWNYISHSIHVCQKISKSVQQFLGEKASNKDLF